MKVTQRNLNSAYSTYEHCSGLVSPGEYQVHSPAAASEVLPDAHLAKDNSLVVMCSASGNYTIVGLIPHRVDIAASAIDQDVYMIAYDHSRSAAHAVMLHHGNWSGRTVKQSQDFFDHISASGTGAHYPVAGMPSAQCGSLADLSGTSYASAFAVGWSALQATWPSGFSR